MRPILPFYLLLIGVYIAISLGLFVIQPVQFYPDSHIYQNMAEQPFFSEAHLLGSRPFTVALFYRAVGGDRYAVTVLQLIVNGLAWVTLAFSLAHGLKTRAMKIAAFGLVLAFSLTTHIFMWHRLVLSESLSHSMLVFSCAAGFFVVRRIAGGRVVGYADALILALTVFMPLGLFSMTRDANSYVALGAALLGSAFLLPKIALERNRPLALMALIVTIGIIGVWRFQEYGANNSNRWHLPFANVLRERVLENDDPSRLAYFTERGMPTVVRLETNLGDVLDVGGDDYTAWLQDHGRATYLGYLLSRPSESFRAPLEAWDQVYSAEIYSISGRGAPPNWQERLTRTLYDWQGWWLLAVVGVAAAFGAMSARRLTPTLAIPAILLAATYPFGFLTYHGDSLEIARHSIAVSIIWRLGVLLLVMIAFDDFLHRATPKTTRRAVGAVLGLLLLAGTAETAFWNADFRREVAYPAASRALPSWNALQFWGVQDAQYFAYQELEQGTPIIEATYDLFEVGWGYYAPIDGLSSAVQTALVDWQNTAMPGHLRAAGYEYVFINAEFDLQAYHRAALAREYDLIRTWGSDRALYRAATDATTWTVDQNADPTQFFLSDERFAAYERHQPRLGLPADAVIFSPLTGALADRTLPQTTGRFIRYTSSDTPALFDLLWVTQRVRYQDELSLDAEAEAAINAWRSSKRSDDLAMAGVRYLFINEAWWSFLSQDELNALWNVDSYRLIYEWDEVSVPYWVRLYEVLPPSN